MSTEAFKAGDIIKIEYKIVRKMEYFIIVYNCYKIILDCSDNNVNFYKKVNYKILLKSIVEFQLSGELNGILLRRV